MPDNKKQNLDFGNEIMKNDEQSPKILSAENNEQQPIVSKSTLLAGLTQAVEKTLHQIYSETLEASLFNQSWLAASTIALIKSMQILSLAMLPNVSFENKSTDLECSENALFRTLFFIVPLSSQFHSFLFFILHLSLVWDILAKDLVELWGSSILSEGV